MIFYIETQMQGNKHIIINSSMLYVLSLAFPDEQFFISCDELHYSNIIAKRPIDGIIVEKLLFPYNVKEGLEKNIIRKIYREVVLMVKIFSLARKYNPKLIFFSSVFPFTFPIMNLLSKFYNRRIIVAMHGDLGVILLKKNYFTTKVFRTFVKWMLRYRNSRLICFLFYGETIRNNTIKKVAYFNPMNTIAIDHPYEFHNKNENNHRIGRTLIFANIGTAILAKNSQNFFRVAFNLRRYVIEKRALFMQIGAMSKEVMEYMNEYVSIAFPESNGEFISPERFEYAISQCDFYLFFYEANTYYDLCPSGTLLDSIKTLTPVIAIRSSYFEYYFNKFGNIGYLCNNIDELKNKIQELIINFPEAEYQVFKRNLLNARTLISDPEIASSFIYQYNRLNVKH